MSTGWGTNVVGGAGIAAIDVVSGTICCEAISVGIGEPSICVVCVPMSVCPIIDPVSVPVSPGIGDAATMETGRAG